MKNVCFGSASLVLLAVAVNSTAQSANSETDPAVDLRTQINHITETQGANAPALHGPLKALGTHHLKEHDYQQSVDVFQQLLHLTRRNTGVWSIDQQDGLELLARSYVGLGDVLKADRLNTMMYRMAAKEYAHDENGMHLARLRLGDWYRDTRRFDQAMDQYEESRVLLDENEYSHLLVSLLRREALTLYLADRCCAAEKLQQIQLLIHQQADYDFSEHLSAKLAYADMAMLERNRATHASLDLVQPTDSPPRLLGLKGFIQVEAAATRSYGDPRSQTFEIDSRSAKTLSSPQTPPSIGHPVQMCTHAVEEYVSRRHKPIEDFYIDVDMRVSDQGKPYDISLDGNAPSGLREYLKRVLQKSRYRPAIDEQGHVRDADLTFRQEFSSMTIGEQSVTPTFQPGYQ